MKIIQVNNTHRILGGSDIVAQFTIDILRKGGNEVFCITRDSKELAENYYGRLTAFICGIYSTSACSEIKKMINEIAPDVIHVHEIYPLFSPWILNTISKLNVPIIMSCHDYRLICPTAHFSCRGRICELCSNGKEYWCIFKNCRGNLFESIAYALRNWMARILKLFINNVSFFIMLSLFQREKLLKCGINEEKIILLNNAVPIPLSTARPAVGKYFAFAGRMTKEKGFDTLVLAAIKTGLPVHFAGDASMVKWRQYGDFRNIYFMGQLNRAEMEKYYRNARCVIVPSECYEVNPLVILEAMSYGLPVIASRIGGIPEMIVEGETGLLFEPGNEGDLANKMNVIWNDNGMCEKLGEAARRKVMNENDDKMYYEQLIAIYNKACGIIN